MTGRSGRWPERKANPARCGIRPSRMTRADYARMSVSKGKRNRRPGGHPAKAVERRERDAARRSRRTSGLGGLAHRILRETQELRGALDAELWASQLLGVFWSERHSLSLEELVSADDTLSLGEPLISAVASLGGERARTALTVISEVDDGELGMLADDLAQRLEGEGSTTAPVWLSHIGKAEITDAAVMREDVFDDARTIFLEARHADGETHAIGVLIDNNIGFMARDILLADSIDGVADVVRENPERDEVTLERIVPGVAAGQIQAAIDLTDMTVDPPVSEEYSPLRAIALVRAGAAPNHVAVPERPEMAQKERDRLLDEFLTSREGEEFAQDSDAAHAASLAIDFCADYVDGRPLRWSPVVVELFMADWVPRKVLADEDLLERLPSALDAWVRFAGRRTGTPDWAVEETRMAIPRWRDEMMERGRDPAAAGPAKQFLTAAKAAGIDVENSDALDMFTAGWNARSEAP